MSKVFQRLLNSFDAIFRRETSTDPLRDPLQRKSQKRISRQVGSVISVGKKAQKGLTGALHGCEKSCQSKGSGFVIYSYFKGSALTAVKGDAKF